MNIWLSILRNIVLLAIGISWGSFVGDTCHTRYDGRCTYWKYAMLDGYMPKYPALITAAVAFLLLALTSEAAVWVLTSTPFSFLGKLSYSLYLIHELFIHWVETETFVYFYIKKEISYDLSVLYTFLIWTPILFFVSWLITIGVDTPATDFANEVD